jgi:hypothetical protein
LGEGLWEREWGSVECCIRPECTRPDRTKRTGERRWDMTRATSCSLRPLSSAQPDASTCDTPCMSDMRVRVPCDRVGKWCVRAHTRERNERCVCVLCGGSAHLRPVVAAHERVRWGMDSSFPLGGDPYREAGAARISTMPLILMDLLSITSSAPSTNPIYRLADRLPTPPGERFSDFELPLP